MSARILGVQFRNCGRWLCAPVVFPPRHNANLGHRKYGGLIRACAVLAALAAYAAFGAAAHAQKRPKPLTQPGCSATAVALIASTSNTSTGTPVTFTVTGISGNCTAYTVRFDFGDGNSTTLFNVTAPCSTDHIYTSPSPLGNPFQATATATGPGGSATSPPVSVTVTQAPPPTCPIGGNDLSPARQTGTTDTSFNFSARLSGTASSGCTYTYTFYFGDGGQTTVTSSSTTASTSHSYSAANTYSASESVTSSPGGVTVPSNPVTVTVNGGSGGCNGVVSNVAIQNTPNPSAVGMPVTCSGSALDSCPGHPLSYSWHFGDGSADVVGDPVIHIYRAAGTYNIILTVTDTVSLTTGMQNSGQIVGAGRLHEAGTPIGTGYDVPTHCAAGKVSGGASRATGNNQVTLSDPVPTRGYPLANNIAINSQVVETLRPMGNATFTYDIHLAQQSLYDANGNLQQHMIVVDGQGTRLDYGTGSTFTSPPGVTASLVYTQTGMYQLTNAGPPDDIAASGNFTYTFTGALQLLQITDPHNNYQSLAYSGPGLQSVTDLSTGKVLTFQWTGANITGITQNGGLQVTALGYSGGMLSSFLAKNSMGTPLARADLSYDSTYPTAIHSVEYDGDTASVSTFDYVPWPALDYSPTLTAPIPMLAHEYETGNSSPVLTLAWTDASVSSPATPFKLAQTNGNGGVTTYWFTPGLDLAQVNQPLLTGQTQAVTTMFSYDANHNQLTASDGFTQVIAAYNSSFLPTSFTDQNQQVWGLTWNGFDLTSVTDPLSHSVSIAYGDAAQPHVATSVTDADGQVWSATHNQFGQGLVFNAPGGGSVGPVSVAYNETSGSGITGYPISVTDGNSNQATIDQYDALGDVLQFSTYPLYGYSNTVHVAYDALQRPTAVTLPDGNTLQNVYTGRNLTKTIDEAGTFFNLVYCPSCGALESVTGPMGWSQAWSFDSDRNLTGFTDANNHTTQYRYGLGDELTKVTFPDGATATATYNNHGQIATAINGRGNALYPLYNTDGSVFELNFSDQAEPRSKFYYNVDGTTSEASAYVRYRDYPTDYNRRAYANYTYTPSGQVASVIYDYHYLAANPATTPITEELDYVYGADGTRTQLTWKHNGATAGRWDYFYDGGGRLYELSNSWYEATNWFYDGESKVVSQLNANPTYETFDYNQQRGWPTDIKWFSFQGRPVSSYHLNYDNQTVGGTVGNLTGITEIDGSVVSYGYDPLYRLTAEQRAGSHPEANTYGYDLAGNRTSVDGTNFTFDAANKLHQINYDGDGDALADLEGSRYTWDSSAMMASAVGTNGIGVENEYDTAGHRIFAHQIGGSGGLDRVFVYDGGQLLGEVSLPSNGSGQAQVTAAYTWGALGLVSERVTSYGYNNSASYWYAFGPQGETRQLTDAGGNVRDSYVYTAYGYPESATHNVVNPFRYGGEFGCYTDPLTAPDLVQCGLRWYSASLGAWLSRDPAGYEGGPNLYAYCFNDPVGFADPLGLGGWDGFVRWYMGDGDPAGVGGMGGLSNLADRWLMGGTTAEYGKVAGEYDSGTASLGQVMWAGGKFCVSLAFAADGVRGAGAGLVALGRFAARAGGRFAAERGLVGAAAITGENLGKSVAMGAAEGSVQACKTGINTGSHAVYRSFGDAGEVNYVGMTKNFIQRAIQQLKLGLSVRAIDGLTNLSAADARAVEQTLIEEHGLAKNGGTLINKINSIAGTNPKYAGALERGTEILHHIGYPGF